MLSLSVCLTSKQNSLPERQQKIYSSIWNLDSPNLARCKINSHAKSPSFTILQLIHSGFRRFNGYSETKAKIIQSLDPAYCSPNGNVNADVIQKQRISDSAFSFIVQMVLSIFRARGLVNLAKPPWKWCRPAQGDLSYCEQALNFTAEACQCLLTGC